MCAVVCAPTAKELPRPRKRLHDRGLDFTVIKVRFRFNV